MKAAAHPQRVSGDPWVRLVLHALAAHEWMRHGMLMGAKRWSKNTPLNTAELRKAIAKKMIAEGRYCY
jgi:hypothetical protein